MKYRNKEVFVIRCLEKGVYFKHGNVWSNIFAGAHQYESYIEALRNAEEIEIPVSIVSVIIKE